MNELVRPARGGIVTTRSSRYVLILADYLIAAGAVILAYWISPSYSFPISIAGRLNPEVRDQAAGMALFVVIGLGLSGLQRGIATRSYSFLAMRVAAGVAGGILAYAIGNALFTYQLVGRYILAYSFAICGIGVIAVRLAFRRIVNQFFRRIVVHGSDNAYAEVKRMLAGPQLPYQICGFWNPSAGGAELPPGQEKAAQPETLSEWCCREGIHDILVAGSGVLEASHRSALMECANRGITVRDLNSFFEENFERVYEPGIDELWFWSFDPIHYHPHYVLFKRGLDIAISSFGLLCSVPLVISAAIAIKLNDGGPVFYSQKRAGKYGRAFSIYKLRTMSKHAEKDGPRWAERTDPRTTAIGSLLRRTRFDEVPQFWNILKGDMSFVGPRPERPEMIVGLEREIRYYRYRHLIKPGLTGWAQINYPYGASVEDARNKLCYDLYYLKHASIRLDVVIIMRTIVAMFRGAR